MIPRSRSRRLILLCGLLPTLAVAVLSLYRPSMLIGLEFDVYDRLVRTVPARPLSDRIVIIDVDERSLATIGQWPWRRDVVGKLVSSLRDLGAAAVALDIVFAEPDRFEGGSVTPDDAFAEVLRGGRVVLGYAMTFDGSHHMARTCVHHPVGLAIVQPPDEQNQRTVLPCDRGGVQSRKPLAGSRGFGLPQRRPGFRRHPAARAAARRVPTATSIPRSRSPPWRWPPVRDRRRSGWRT